MENIGFGQPAVPQGNAWGYTPALHERAVLQGLFSPPEPVLSALSRLDEYAPREECIHQYWRDILEFILMNPSGGPCLFLSEQALQTGHASAVSAAMKVFDLNAARLNLNGSVDTEESRAQVIAEFQGIYQTMEQTNQTLMSRFVSHNLALRMNLLKKEIGGHIENLETAAVALDASMDIANCKFYTQSSLKYRVMVETWEFMKHLNRIKEAVGNFSNTGSADTFARAKTEAESWGITVLEINEQRRTFVREHFEKLVIEKIVAEKEGFEGKIGMNSFPMFEETVACCKKEIRRIASITALDSGAKEELQWILHGRLQSLVEEAQANLVRPRVKQEPFFGQENETAVKTSNLQAEVDNKKLLKRFTDIILAQMPAMGNVCTAAAAASHDEPIQDQDPAQISPLNFDAAANAQANDSS